MTDYQKYINALRKCAKEHENDTTYTGHIIVSDLCRDTANLLEALEQEPIKQIYIEREVLDKIRAEIDKIYKREGNSVDCFNALNELKWFIDKYKAETEEDK